MKFYKKIMLILIVFFKTETLFSENSFFNVNNIELEKKDKMSNNTLAEQAIKKGFNQLTEKILLNEDRDKLLEMNLASIKELVTYYQISNISDEKKKNKLVSFSITFDKEKIHKLFYDKGILYSEILDKEFYILPIFIQKDEVYIFNNNFFYKNWNLIYKDQLIEFILPIENIEIIKNVNEFKNNLTNLNLANLFEEYKNKNLALILIEDNETPNKKIFIKTRIQGKNIAKSLVIKNNSLDKFKFYEKIITETKRELIKLIKSNNLIDVRTPFFLNVKLNLNKKSNLVELHSRIKNIDIIENIYVQEFNKDYMSLRIKYLGKLDKIIRQLKKQNIDLKLVNDQWTIKTL